MSCFTNGKRMGTKRVWKGKETEHGQACGQAADIDMLQDGQ